MNLILYILSGVVILTGLMGSVLPMIPGVPLMFLGILLAAYINEFQFISTATLIFLFLITLLSLGIDYASGVIGAKMGKSSAAGVVGALLGSVFGIAVLGPLGIFLGPVLGVFAFEYLAKRSVKDSTRAAKFTLVSSFIGSLVNILLALLMLIVFVGAIFL